MQIVLKHITYQIKNGYAAHSPELGLTAHGYSPEVAQRNLERLGLLFFRPFERQGKLTDEVELLGLKAEADGADLKITITTS
jgi:hypothetical protein